MKIKERLKIKDKLKRITDELVVDRVNSVEWIALGLILLLIFATLYYQDYLVIFLSYFWDNEATLEGVDLGMLGNNRMAYGMVHQILGRLWVLPLNIVYIIHPFQIANNFTLLWFKFGIAIIYTLAMKEMINIARIMNIEEERIKWMLILFSSSVLVALPVFHISQTDILSALMLLIALRYVLQDNQKMYLIFSALAVSCKLMSLIALIPLLLLMEKRILNVIGKTILVTLVYPLEYVWYKIIEWLGKIVFAVEAVSDANATSSADATIVVEAAVQTVAQEATETVKSQDQVAVDFVNHFYNKALYFEFPAIRKGYVASLMVFLFVLLCVWCYAQKKSQKEEQWKEICVYTAAVTWLIFFTNASPSPYWIVMMYPFVFLMIFAKGKCIRINMLLYSAYTLIMFLVYVIDTSWVYGGSMNLDFLLLKWILPEGHDSSGEGPYVARYLNNLHVDKFMNIFTAVCLAAAVGLIVVNHYRVEVDEEIDSKYEKQLMHGFTIFQIAFLWLWYAFSIYAITRW